MPPSAAYSIARAMTLLPFGIIIAVYGMQTMMRDRRWRWVGAVVLVAIPLQFALFARDYRSDYQLRVAPRLDPGNVRAIADAVIAQDATAPVAAIYLSDNIDDGGVRWRFFTLKHGRLDLWARTHSLNLAHTLPAIEPGALVICYAADPLVTRLESDGYRTVAAVAGVAGEAAAVVLKAPG
jgi:hypothetical protein